MVDDLPTLDRRITEALAALRRARAVVERSPNKAMRWREDLAEQTLDDLLDQRSRVRREAHAHQLAATIHER